MRNREALRRHERLVETAELAVTACLPLLPLHGSWDEGYQVDERAVTTLRATPDEWAGAAYWIAKLHAEVLAEQNGR